MSKSEQVEMNKQLQNEHQEKLAPLVQDVRDPFMTAHYKSLSEGEYLDTIWGEMKSLFSKCDFKSRRNESEDIFGTVGTRLNNLYWPSIPPQLYECESAIESVKNTVDNAEAVEEANMTEKTIISFCVPHHKMVARYSGSFGIKNAVVRAKFVGDKKCHSFYHRGTR